MTQITMLSAADQKYERFILPFMATSLWNYPDSKVEVIVTRKCEAVRQDWHTGLNVLRNHFGRDRIRIVPVAAVLEGTEFRASTIRLLQEPILHSPYTYVVDIDILYLLPDLTGHFDYMKKLELPYSNMVRANQQHLRLTGMHFVRTDDYYPKVRDYVARRARLMRRSGRQFLDERELYRMCKRCVGLPDHETHGRYRPVPGFHPSMNRTPAGSDNVPGWGLGHREMKRRWGEVRATDMWQELLPHMHTDAAQRIRTIDEILGFANGKG